MVSFTSIYGIPTVLGRPRGGPSHAALHNAAGDDQVPEEPRRRVWPLGHLHRRVLLRGDARAQERTRQEGTPAQDALSATAGVGRNQEGGEARG